MNQSFTYDGPRIGRTIVSLAVLIICPLLISQFSSHDTLIFALFGCIATVWFGGVLLTTLRFRLVLGDTYLTCRGRFTSRTIQYDDITSISLRQGRDRAGRFSANTTLRELVIQTKKRALVLSSIPLGSDGFNRVSELLKARLDPSIWQSDSTR